MQTYSELRYRVPGDPKAHREIVSKREFLTRVKKLFADGVRTLTVL